MRIRRASVSDEVLFVLLTVVSCALVSVTEAYLDLDTPTADTDENSSSPMAGSNLICWTCPNKTDNEACNNWAPYVPCPLNHTVCKTVHRVNRHSGSTVSVHKMCARDTHCNWDMVGCYETELSHVMECISCCNYDYCNEPVPFNRSSAIDLSSSVASGATSVTTSQTVYTAPLCYLAYVTTLLFTHTYCFSDISTLVEFLINGLHRRTVSGFKKDYLVH